MRVLASRTIFVIIFISSCLLFTYKNVSADTDTYVSTEINHDAIGKQVSYLLEKDKALSLNDAIKIYQAGNFSSWNKSVLSFGVGTSPVWVKFTVNNNGNQDASRRLIIENSWLDLAELYIIYNGQLVKQQHSGDSLTFSQRTSGHRFLTFDYNYKPGLSEV